jgi:starch synthase (maltosyl-transferring)
MALDASQLASVFRVVIQKVEPEVDGGRFPIKRTVGESIHVRADIVGDGHDALRAVLRHRPASNPEWEEHPMELVVNDSWKGEFRVSEQGHHFYTIQAWVDHFESWRRDLLKKAAAGQDLTMDLLVGVEMIEDAARRASGSNASELTRWATDLRSLDVSDPQAAAEKATSPELAQLMERNADRSRATTYHELPVVVDREKARFSAWYEMFPRSAALRSHEHGTFQDVEKMLPYVSEMGFDVLYFPPIHPIGRINRKGKNNTEQAAAAEVGSPWAIGSKEGGHTAIHPQLGTLEDFRRLMARAKEFGIEVAIDIAYQCAPDHPYVKEHREWFRIRPDGSVQYAENPPKKYQDIYPLNFESSSSLELCEELKNVVVYWAQQGVRIFRVDNPHTKPFPFWEWLIAEIKSKYPDALFLSEAFTRPKMMYELAKRGFTQSYTYFAWRNTKWELTEYFAELTKTEVREYFRPNLWPNTPDILTEFLQFAGRPSFAIRLVLAATLGANYGIYGPAFELMENRPLRQGSEEYLNSEKYEIRNWDIGSSDSLKDLIARVNQIRRENRPLQSDWSLTFHHIDNDQIVAYSKTAGGASEVIVVVVNLDPHYVQSGWLELPLEAFKLDPHQPYQMHDLLSGERFLWQGPRNYIELRPHESPAHIFRLRRHLRTEQDFDYFM